MLTNGSERRGGSFENVKFAFGPFLLDPRERSLFRSGTPVRLTPKAFDVLCVLVESHGQLVDKSVLLERVWPDTFVEETNLTFNIHHVRKALGNDPDGTPYIETVPRRGYRFGAAVTTIGPGQTDARLSEEPTRAAAPEAVAQPQSVWSRRALAAGVSVAALAVIALVIAGTTRLSHRRQEPVLTSSTLSASMGERKPRRSLAVLDVVNASGQTHAAWVSGALADMISTHLAAGEVFRVIPRDRVVQLSSAASSASNAEGDKPNTPPTRAGAVLGADLIVVGSFTVLGSSTGAPLRIDLHVEQARTGEIIAAVFETGSLGELFELASRTATRLRDKLQIAELSSVDAEGVRASLPVSAGARRAYLEGLSRLRRGDALGAKTQFLRLTHAEPSFPLAHARLAEAWSALGYDRDAVAEAKTAFDLSAGLAQEQRLSLEAEFRSLSHEWNLAAEIFQRLLKFFPDEVDYALALADAQVWSGSPQAALSTIETFKRWPPPLGNDLRLDLATLTAREELGQSGGQVEICRQVAQNARALQAKPIEAQAHLREARAHRESGQLSEAGTAAAQARDLYRDFGDEKGYARALVELANDLREKKQPRERRALYEEARTVYQQLGNKKGEADTLNNLGGLLEDEADLTAAERAYSSSLEIRRAIDDRRGMATSLNNLADIHEVRGDFAGARRLYQRALEQYRAADVRDGIALTLGEIGGLLYLQGDLAGAKGYLEQSVAQWRAINNRGLFAQGALATLGQVLIDVDDLPGARKAFEEALSWPRESTTQTGANNIRIMAADLDIEVGKAAEAEAIVRGIRSFLQEHGAPFDVFWADVRLAKALLAQNKAAEASTVLAELVQLPPNAAGHLGALEISLVRAQIDAVTGREAAAIRQLQDNVRAARRAGLLGHELLDRLTLWSLELKGDSPERAIAGLRVLVQDADAKGFRLIARKTRMALELQSAQANRF